MEYGEAYDIAFEICEEYESQYGKKLITPEELAELLMQLPEVPEELREEILHISPKTKNKKAKIKKIIKKWKKKLRKKGKIKIIVYY